jgi:hypothetical protein
MFPKETPRSKEISAGIFHGSWSFAVLLVVCGWIMWLGCAAIGLKNDSDQSSWSHSGMDILTDAKTGCQYLSHDRGLTPRLDTIGHQICK